MKLNELKAMRFFLRMAALGVMLAALGITAVRADDANTNESQTGDSTTNESRTDDEVNPKPGLSIGIRGAYFRPIDADDGDYFGGVQVRLHLSPAIALEGSADYRRNKFAESTVHTYPVQASLLLYLIPNKVISPFLLGGAGWYYSTVEGPENTSNTQNRFGAHAGGGLQVWLNEYWSLDGTYRYIWLETVKSKNAALQDKDFKDSGHMFTTALNFHF